MSDVTIGTSRVPLLKHTYRVASYMLAAVAGLLCVATVSGRLLMVDKPWEFFAVGAIIGALCALIEPGLSRLPGELPTVRVLPYLLFAIIGALISALAGLVLTDLSVSLLGVIVIAITCCALSSLVYLVADSAEEENANRVSSTTHV